VTELIVHPTAKFIKAGAILAAIVVLALEIAYLAKWRDNDKLTWVPIAAPLVLLWPAERWLRRRFTKAVFTADQRLAQRLWKVGDLSIETAGETSRLTIRSVDDPQALADDIMTRAQTGPTGT
jgi:hypothetical protein